MEVMVSWLEINRLKVTILFGSYGKTSKQEICETLAWKEDHMKHQQGKKIM